MSSQNIITLTEAAKREIQAALQAWKSDEKNGDASKISKETFPLPTLGPQLEAIARDLHSPSGSGYYVLRGLEVDASKPEDALLVYLGICSYIGSQRGAQNKKRDMVTHITDAKQWSNVPHDKRHGIHTTSALPFHTDMGCEILALHYRETARAGGATSLAPAVAVYRDLAASHPRHLRALQAADWPVQLAGGPAPRFARLPLLAVDAERERVLISVDPGRLGLHPATAGLRADCDLDGEQLEALAALAASAEKHAVTVPAERGDVLFINNLAVLHKREAYVDGEDEQEGVGRRHLVRVWLRNAELAWDIPENMKAPWYAAYGGRDGAASIGEIQAQEEGAGRFLKMAEDRYQVVPEKEYKVPRYSSGSAAWLIDADEA